MATAELLERQNALAQLGSALADARAGRGRVVLVAGEAGIGKSSLVERFAAQRPNDMRLLWGACEPFLEPRPFGPLHDLAGEGGELQAVLQGTGDLDAVERACLSTLREPGLLVIEDLHWADEATLNVLRRIGPELAALPVLVIVTTRDDAVAIRPLLQTFLTHLAGWPAVERLDLQPLSTHAVAQLIGDRRVDPVSLHQETGGNPFFVTEALAAGGSSLPPSIRDAVWARATSLPVPGRAVVEAAAIIGARSERWLLTVLTEDAQGGLEQAVSAGLLTDAADSLAFRHELTRQAILESIPLSRSVALHALALKALLASPETHHDWTRLAHHAVGAGDADAIWTYAREAGRQAAWARAHNAAVAWFERALEQVSGRPDGEAAALYDAFGQECDTVDRRRVAIAARERAAVLWEKSGDVAQLGESLSHQATLLQLVGRMPEAIAVNTRALAALEQLGPSEALVSAYNAQAWLHLGSGTSEAGAEVAERAIQMAEAIGARSDLPRLTEVAGLCELYRDYERAMALLDRSLALALEHEQMTRAGNTYANLGSIYIDFHQFRQAESVQAHGLAFARSHELKSVYAFIEGWQAVLQMHLGQWAAADETIALSLERAAPSPGRGSALLALGRLRTRRGDGDAVGALRESLGILQRQGFRQREGLIRGALAEAAWQAGDVDAVMAEVEEGLALALRFRQPWYVGELGYWAWRAGRPVELPEWAAEPYRLQIAGLWDEAAGHWLAMGCPYEQARALAEGDSSGRADAVEILQRLGAGPALRALRRHPRSVSLDELAARPRLAGLTTRQSLVADLIAEGLTNVEIAARLKLSVKTIDHHVAAILARFDVADRGAAARLTRAARARA